MKGKQKQMILFFLLLKLKMFVIYRKKEESVAFSTEGGADTSAPHLVINEQQDYGKKNKWNI